MGGSLQSFSEVQVSESKHEHIRNSLFLGLQSSYFWEMVSRDHIFFFCILPHLMVTFLYVNAKFFNEFWLDPSLFMVSTYLFFSCTRHLQNTDLGPEHTLGECVRHWWLSQIASSGQARTRNSSWCRIHSTNLTHAFMVTWHTYT